MFHNVSILNVKGAYYDQSTLMVGFRYGLHDRFQFALETGVGIGVFLVGALTYTELYETEDKRLFYGLRTITGFKWKDTYLKVKKAVLAPIWRIWACISILRHDGVKQAVEVEV